MPLSIWMPEVAGGVNLFADASSLPAHQLVQCDNYYPHGRRWRMINGHSAFTSPAIPQRFIHLVEFQQDDSSGSTNKKFVAVLDNGTDELVYEISNGSTTVQVGTLTGATGSLTDTTVFTGIFLLANPSVVLQETSSAAAASLSATAGTPPANPRYVEAWKNRVFLAGRSAAPLTTFYCADGDRTTWSGSDTGSEVVTSSMGDFITGIRSVENYLAMFTRRTITLLIGDHPDNWTKRTIYEDHGCISHRTVQKAFGGLIYANDVGVWFLDADGRRRELSRDIRPYWQNLASTSTQRNKARGRFMHAVYDPTPDMNRYYIWVAEGSSTKENVCWIYHFNQDAWSKMVSFMDSGMTCQASALREDTSGNLNVHFSAGSDNTTTSDKRSHKIDGSTSFAAVTGGNIAAVLQSGILSPFMHGLQGPYMSGLATVKHWKNLYAKFTDGPSTGNLTFDFSLAHKATLVDQATRNIAYGGTGNITRERVPIAKTGWGIQVKVSRTATGDHDFIGGIFEIDDKGTI